MKGVFLFIIILMSSLLPPVVILHDQNQIYSASADSYPLQTVESTFDFNYSKSFSGDTDQTLDPTPLNITDTVNNISSFAAPGVDVFLGNDPIPDLSNVLLRKVRVTLTESTIRVIKESPPGDGNEIVFISYVNHKKVVSGEYKGVFPNDTIYPSLTLFDDWILDSESIQVDVEVWEADIVDSDSMGNLTLIKPSIPNIYTINTDTNEANVTLNMEILDSKYGITADDLLEGSKPYIWMAPEVAETAPDDVYARVLKGDDPYLGQEALCLQYYLYWEKEYFPFNLSFIGDEGALHRYDYEVFLLFFDLQDFLDPDPIVGIRPFRAVYDIGGYLSVEGWYYHKLTIWEKDASAKDYTNHQVAINPIVAPLLGGSTSMDFNVRPLSNLSLHRGKIGTKTVTITVETAFHTFSNNDPPLALPYRYELGFNYNVDEFTDSIIRDWYDNYQESLQNGSYTINLPVFGYYVSPIVSPFPHDVTNPFAFPHATNAWKNLWENITAFELSKTNQFNLGSLLSGAVGLFLPLKMSLTAPETVKASEKFEAQLKVDLEPSEADVKVDYTAGQNLGLGAWFLRSFLNYSGIGALSIDFGLATIFNLLTNLTANSQKNDTLVSSGILEIEYSHINPQGAGPMVNTSSRIHLWQAVGTIFSFIPMVSITDYFFDAIDLQPKILLTSVAAGRLEADSYRVQISNPDINLSENASQKIEIIPDQWLGGSDISLEVKNVSYAAQFSIDWYFHVNFKSPFDDFLGNHSWHLGTFPILNLDEDQAAFLSALLGLLMLISVLAADVITIPIPGFEALIVIVPLALGLKKYLSKKRNTQNKKKD